MVTGGIAMFQRQWRQAQRPRKHGTKAKTEAKTAGKKVVARKKPVWDVRYSSIALASSRDCTAPVL